MYLNSLKTTLVCEFSILLETHKFKYRIFILSKSWVGLDILTMNKLSCIYILYEVHFFIPLEIKKNILPGVICLLNQLVFEHMDKALRLIESNPSAFFSH